MSTSVYVCVSVCMYVRLSVREHICRITRAILTKFLRMLHMAVARNPTTG